MPSLLAEQWVIDASLWGMVSVGLAGGLCGLGGARLAQRYAGLLARGCEPDAAMLGQALMIVIRRGSAPGVAFYPWLFLGAGSLMACATGILYLRYGFSLYFCALTGATLVLLVLALIDSICGLLPDALTLPLMWAGLFVAWLGHGPTLHQAVSGIFLGYLFPWALFFVYKCARRVDGMGHGDFKLLAALGAWLGWEAIGPVLLGASLAAIVAAMWHQKSLLPGGSYPFGPFLIVSAMGFFVSGSALHSWFI